MRVVRNPPSNTLTANHVRPIREMASTMADWQIAEQFGVTPSAVTKFRHRNKIFKPQNQGNNPNGLSSKPNGDVPKKIKREVEMEMMDGIKYENEARVYG